MLPHETMGPWLLACAHHPPDNGQHLQAPISDMLDEGKCCKTKQEKEKNGLAMTRGTKMQAWKWTQDAWTRLARNVPPNVLPADSRREVQAKSVCEGDGEHRETAQNPFQQLWASECFTMRRPLILVRKQ